MDTERIEQLSSWADESADSAEDMHGVAACLRDRVGERGDEVDELLEAFDYFYDDGGWTPRFAPIFCSPEGSYPAPLNPVTAETLEVWEVTANLTRSPVSGGASPATTISPKQHDPHNRRQPKSGQTPSQRPIAAATASPTGQGRHSRNHCWRRSRIRSYSRCADSPAQRPRCTAPHARLRCWRASAVRSAFR